MFPAEIFAFRDVCGMNDNIGWQNERKDLMPSAAYLGDDRHFGELKPEEKWIFSEEGQTAVQKAAALRGGDEWKRILFLREKLALPPEKAALAAVQVVLRSRGKEKFAELAERMFFTQVGIEQSSDRWIAEYKAKRFPEGVPAADICCGIGGDLLALAAAHPVLGVDRSPMTALAAHFNLTAAQEAGVLPEDADFQIFPGMAEEFLERFPAERFPLLHMDPDRRSEGVRTTQIDYFQPEFPVLEKLLEGRRLAAVKLAPGTEIPETWLSRMTEAEWITRNRECRQLIVWFDAEKERKGDFRATLLETHGAGVLGTFAGKPNLPLPAAEIPGRFLFDPDPSLLAAGLEGDFAQTYALKRLGPGSLYLTGEKPVENALAACFEIRCVLPLDRKQIVRAVQESGWSRIEIKKRGAVPEPEEVRKWLKLPKKGGMGTLFLARTASGSLALLANRVF